MRIFIKIFLLLCITINIDNTHWVIQKSGTPRHLYDIEIKSSDTLYCAGEHATVTKTINSGTNWAAQTSSITGEFTGISLINAETGLVLGG